jgi:hypothetical protein
MPNARNEEINTATDAVARLRDFFVDLTSRRLSL